MAGEHKGQTTKSSRGKRKLLVATRRMFLSQYIELVAAVRFLTILPMPGKMQLFEKDEVTARFVVGCTYFPLVGLLLACLLCFLCCYSCLSFLK
jgi:cobalamin synthase